jgi:glutathione S-transferase
MDVKVSQEDEQSPALLVYGTPISTFVRKVLLVLEHKGLAYAMRMPPKAQLLQLNPLGKVPVLQAGDEVIVDSSVICDYLEGQFPTRPVYPSALFPRARALWIEEYADTALQDAFFPLMNETLFKPKVYGQAGNPDVIAEATVAAGRALDYLEAQLHGPCFVENEPTIADFTVMAVLGNPLRGGFSLDPARWAKLASYVPRMLAREPFNAVWRPYETAFDAVARGEHLRGPAVVDT